MKDPCGAPEQCTRAALLLSLDLYPGNSLSNPALMHSTRTWIISVIAQPNIDLG